MRREARFLEVRAAIPTGPRAPAEARQLVGSVADQLAVGTADELRLLISELVTNSVKHAGNPPGHPIEVTLTLRPDRVRLEVVDRSIFDPTPETSTELREVKWGLLLVDRIAEGWGRISDGGIWAELRRPSAE